IGTTVKHQFNNDLDVELAQVALAGGPTLSSSFAYDRDGLIQCVSGNSACTSDSSALTLIWDQNGLLSLAQSAEVAEELSYNSFGELTQKEVYSGREYNGAIPQAGTGELLMTQDLGSAGPRDALGRITTYSASYGTTEIERG